MIFYNLFVAPIEMLVDWVFTFFTIKFSSFGVIGAVCGVSLVINFLALPIYNVADALQAKERKIAKEMEPRVKRIKMAFKGDERFMMLQTYYRECKYNPIYTLRSSLSILIEIPFFIAAYHYLSHAEALKGVSFWIFKDLGAADSLFHIGSFPVNVLPILMTAINLVSGAVYSKDTTLREKIQIYVLAAVFLALLYNSPSGLVIYWILNNLFSLAKNVVLKMKNPGKVLLVIVDAILGLFAVYFLFFNDGSLKKRILLAAFAAIVICFPVLKKVFKRHCEKRSDETSLRRLQSEAISSTKESHSERSEESARDISLSLNMTEQTSPHDKLSKSQFALFLFSALGLALLCGFYLPSSAISTSPTEFSFLGEGADSPLTYVWSSLFTFLGFFAFWPTLIYFMFSEKVKKWETAVFFVAFLTALADVFIFKADYGTVDVLFTLDDKKVVNANLMLKIFPFILSGILFVIYSFLRKFNLANFSAVLVFAICLTESLLSFSNTSSINKKFIAYSENISHNLYSTNNADSSNDKFEPIYYLTRTGKNVVVIFLDRAINSFFPYALQDIPELKEQMNGFVYYPNTLSFGTYTDIATPAMMAGYEYTPEKINERKDELLRIKHNEASLVIPKIFADSDYEITITDPPCPNYAFKGDLSAFEGEKNIHAFELFGKFSEKFMNETEMYNKIIIERDLVKNVLVEIKKFSILQIVYPIFRRTFYDNFRVENHFTENRKYVDVFSCLYYLPELTKITSGKNQYIFIDNETTHNPVSLDDNFILPDDSQKYTGSYKTTDKSTERHYCSFVAAFKQIGKWLEFLKKNQVYDNTRIIIVSDHGRALPLNQFKNFEDPTVPSSYSPVLLFKDFNSNAELSTNNTFMTNADTLFFAKKDLNLSDENPFTHKKIIQEKTNGITVYPIVGTEWNEERMVKKTQFTLDKSKAYHVQDDIFDGKNWIPLLDWERAVVELDNERHSELVSESTKEMLNQVQHDSGGEK